MEDLGLIPRLGRSHGGGPGNPLQYTCLENPYGQRSLVGYSSWGHKESETNELCWLSTMQHKILLKGKSDQIYKNFLQLKKKLKHRTFFLCEHKTLRSYQYSSIVTYLHVKVLWCSHTTSREKFTILESQSSQAF